MLLVLVVLSYLLELPLLASGAFQKPLKPMARILCSLASLRRRLLILLDLLAFFRISLQSSVIRACIYPTGSSTEEELSFVLAVGIFLFPKLEN